MPRVIQLSDAEFKQLVINPKEPAVVMWGSEGCAPCIGFKPVYEELATEYLGKVVFFYVNTDIYQGYAAEFKVPGMPTFDFFNKGENHGRFIGAPAERHIFTTFVNQLMAATA